MNQYSMFLLLHPSLLLQPVHITTLPDYIKLEAHMSMYQSPGTGFKLRPVIAS